MTIFKCSVRTWLVRLMIVVAAGSLIVQCVKTVRAKIQAELLSPVSLSARHHLGQDFNIPSFYVDRSIGDNIGREGDSGTVCCILLPNKWRPGLSVEVRWEINDWSHEIVAETDVGNYDSLGAGGIFIAQVPVERYENAEHVWVHFFAGDKVRVISSSIGSWGKAHPIQSSDPHAGDRATAGRRISAMFSPAELLQLDLIDRERKKQLGDWR